MKYGCKKELADKRDYKVHFKKSSNIPKEYQIQNMSEIKNQGDVSSCVAHALAKFLEHDFYKEKKIFSVGFIYGYRPIFYSYDEGMYPREALKTLKHIGDCENKLFDYNLEMPEIKAKVDSKFYDLKDNANKYKIDSYARIYTISEIKQCLLRDCPVPVSIPVYNNLSYDKNYVIQDNPGNPEGYHMIILDGYNELGFTFSNSWGTSWGNSGRAILPYTYTIDSAWAISTSNNTINTKQKISQKILKILNNILKLFIK